MSIYTRDRLREKVEWEGGVLATIEYGITETNIDPDDPDLREAWAAIETAYKALTPLISKVNSLLSGDTP